MASLTVDAYRVEVTAREGDSSTQRGDLLETLAKRILTAMQCQHVETKIRLTGIEIDVVGSDVQSGEKIIVECKAYRDRTISSDVVMKILGQVAMYGYSSGWLLSTSELGKDAKGLRDEWLQKPENERKKLRFYDPQKLIELLQSTGRIVEATSLRIPERTRFSRTPTLLITDIGEFWAIAAIGSASGVPDTVLAFDAQTGKQITEKLTLNALSERDSSLRELTWVGNDEEASAAAVVRDTALKKELDSIAPVPIADTWSDYRPARPQDFVGRDELLKGILQFVDEVRTNQSQSRLLAIKAPSGWGKSSFLNKLRATCSNIRNRNRVFLYGVDCRTAISARYPELSLKRCFDEAASSGFLSEHITQISVGSAHDPFGSPSCAKVLEHLRNEQKAIVLFFDQFEEITSREDFADLFFNIRAMCSAIDSAKENVILGFSWKTDGVIPTDHPAYYIWHQFGDRRREFEVPLFSAADIAKLLTGLAKELTHPIDPSLRRLLGEQCQGYPWLLKKLCIHVFRVLKSSPNKQRELLERTLDIDALFKKDLENLQAVETECIKRIAKESPADFYSIENTFGAGVISHLTDKRLIVRSAGKIILYWDIFREYVLTGRVPNIPNRYIPVNGPATTKAVISILVGSQSSSLSSLSKKSSLKVATLDNIARDLVMMGVAQYDRKEQRVRLSVHSQAEILQKLFLFVSSHILYKRILENSSTSPSASIGITDLVGMLKATNAGGNYSDNTWRNSAQRLLSWMSALGLVRWEQDERISVISNPTPPKTIEQLTPGTRRGAVRSFKGDAPPHRVQEVLKSLLDPNYHFSREDRNPLYVLRGLGVVASASDPLLIERPSGDLKLWLAIQVLQAKTFLDAWELCRKNPDISASEVGRVVEDAVGRPLAPSSLQRYGSGLQVWVRWVEELLEGQTPSENALT